MNLSKKALLLSFAVFASTAASLSVPENASAAFSGANGKVMYSDYMPQQGALTSDMGTIDPDGQNQIASLLHSEYSWYLAPRYSADGTKITYTENFPVFGASDIFVANADGTNPVNISNITGFSPNQIPS
jgi:hypothetical protein